MKTRILLPQTGADLKEDDVLYIATEAEKYDIDSVWVFERQISALKP